MLWVALDRAAQLAADRDDADPVAVDRWRANRDALRRQIEELGVRDGAFVQRFDAVTVDAALLILPQVGFCAPDDPRFVATVERILTELGVGEDGFILRYRTDDGHDGLAGEEGTFLMCSFWLVEALAGMGRTDQAEALFDRLLGVANDVGLYAEEYDPATGQMLGNFPQAFTHMALITAAASLRRHRALDTADPLRSTPHIPQVDL
jgi:GH15 family glucan-1,4-alpha-glucosidase